MPQPYPYVPSGAKPVFRGQIFTIWQWSQRQYDGSEVMYECATRPDYVSVIATVGDKVIVLEEMQPHWDKPRLSLPGGRADSGGSMLEEAQRELLEETGYGSDEWHHWRSVEQPYPVMFRGHFFLARNCRPLVAPKPDAGEKITLHFIGFDDFLLLSEDPAFRGSDMRTELLRLRLHPDERESFRRILFGSSPSL